MFSRADKVTIILLTIVVVGFCGILIPTFVERNEKGKLCVERGGYWVDGRDVHICVKKDAIIHLN